MVLAIRITAIAFFVYGTQRIGDNYFSISRALEYSDEIHFIYIIIISLIMPFVVAVALWFLSRKITNALFKGVTINNPLNKCALTEVQEVAFSIVGLVLLAFTLSKILSWAYWFATFDPEVHEKPDLIGLGIIVATNTFVGIWLLFGSRGIVTLVRKLRYAGTNK